MQVVTRPCMHTVHAEFVFLKSCSSSGTKFLSASLIAEDAPHGHRVHDCHAEPLARRALLRWLHLEIRRLLDAEILSEGPEVPSVMRPPRLQRCGDNQIRSGTLHMEKEASGTDIFPHSPLFELCSGSSLHLYCSSCPCGNASLRRCVDPLCGTYKA